MLQSPSALLRRLRAFALFAVAFAWFALGASEARAAQPLDPKAVPDPLKPWTAWVLDGHEDTLCPTLHLRAETSRCAWPARLELALDEGGGRFTQTWHLDARRSIPLPGDAKRWPLDVTVDGKRAIVTSKDELPHVELEPGDHTLRGAFAWGSLPESLRVPPETGLLALTLRGQGVAAPQRDAQGTVWLQKASKNAEGDALEFVVHRQVTDDIPLLLTTRIELRVSGKNREALLGRALPAGFVPLSLTSAVPARLEPDGRLRVQLRPGVFVLELVARGEGVVDALTRPDPDGPWREGDEVWVFDAKSDYRVVSVEGVVAIDPQQTTLPDAWKRLPAYPMKLGDTLRLVERRRGDADPPPNQLSLTRSLWLDFDGAGFTASDMIQGTLNRDSRLTMSPSTTLGRVAIGGRDQFITHLGDATRAGVEVRQGSLVVTADSRIVGDPSDIPAVSWEHDFHQVSGSLSLPPGWRLFHASGVDDVPGTWVRHWSLLELFLALVLAIALGRLHGAPWGALALVTMALTFPEDGAPKWSWVFVILTEALFRVIPSGRVKSFFAGARIASLVAVILIALPFAVEQVRQGIYPALADAQVDAQKEVFADAASSLEGGTGARAKAEAQTEAVNAPVEHEPASDELERSPKPLMPPAPPQEVPVQQQRPTPGKIRGLPSSSSWDDRYAQSNAQVYDPAAVVQTGPGLPRWRWTTLSLTWSGPVAAAQRLHLYLLSPLQNLLLGLARTALLAFLLLRLFPWTWRKLRPGGGRPSAPVAAAIVFGMTLLAWPSAARADVPDKATLEELKDRLLRKPSCAPSCASSGRMLIDVRGGVLRARLEVDARAKTAVPLPGSSSQWTPREVLVDGKPATALARIGEDLWLEVAEGAHQIVLEGPMPDRETMQLALPLKPHHVETSSDGWTVEGVHEDGLADDNLQFTRTRASAGGGTLQPGALPTFARVERTLRVGLNWQVETRVVRASPTGTAVVLEIPLIPGESVTTAETRVVSGKVLVNMGPQATEASWHSVLEQRSPVRLVATKSLAWTEVWRVDVGPIWHAKYSGIPFVHTQPTGTERIPEWRPWPGEEGVIELSRPDGVAGQTLTIDQSTATVRPGLRVTDVTLRLSVRSSRGAQHTITLPEGAQLESLTINGATQPLRQDGRKVTLPIVPGAQEIELQWRESSGIAPYFSTKTFDLGAPSVNANTVLEVPAGRWLLFARGPRLGPAVLVWSLLIVLLGVALALGKNRWTPLRWWHWFFLAVGLSQVHVVTGALFVGWLLALGWRAKNPGEGMGFVAFDLRQLVLIVLTFVALLVLGVSIYQGLLGAPEMQVRGNGSTEHTLRWFTDRSGPELPTSWILSVPLLVYRGVMLAWALWIAFALIRWLRWGWSAFTAGGAWKKPPPPPPRVPPAPHYPQAPYPPQGYPQPPPPQPPPAPSGT